MKYIYALFIFCSAICSASGTQGDAPRFRILTLGSLREVVRDAIGDVPYRDGLCTCLDPVLEKVASQNSARFLQQRIIKKEDVSREKWLSYLEIPDAEYDERQEKTFTHQIIELTVESLLFHHTIQKSMKEIGCSAHEREIISRLVVDACCFLSPMTLRYRRAKEELSNRSNSGAIGTKRFRRELRQLNAKYNNFDL